MSQGFDVIGERQCDQPVTLVKQFQQEALTAFAAENWQLERENERVRIDSTHVIGELAPTHLRVMRSSGEIDFSADEVFDFLTSPAGFVVLDPVSRESDQYKPVLQTYPWKAGSRLELATATIEMPVLKRDFLVLNAIDVDQKLFTSKSVVDSSYPGASKHYRHQTSSGKHPRALNTFALKVTPINEHKCCLEMLNYLNLEYPFGEIATILNYSNRRLLEAVYTKLPKFLDKAHD